MKTALITGASSGLGAALAKRLSAEGYALILVARRTERMERLTADWQTPVKIIGADLADDAGVRTIFAETEGQNVDLLVNNAGFGAYGPFVENDPDTGVRMIDVNCKAVQRLTRHFLPQMLERGSGTVLNIASVAGFLTGPLMADYYAAKAYVLSLTKSLSGELAHTGGAVRVCALCPGPFASEFNQTARIRTALRGLSCEAVADAAVKAIHGRKTVVYPGIAAKLARFGVRLAPERLLTYAGLKAQLRKR